MPDRRVDSIDWSSLSFTLPASSGIDQSFMRLAEEEEEKMHAIDNPI